MQKIFYVVVALAALLVLGYCSHDAFAQENSLSIRSKRRTVFPEHSGQD